ncbi:FtsX-like permease family protein [Flavobacteriales bacterium]|nr:FtsX-like permease family protein [Flavobacteriales bacterium]MDG1145803.1 FtsX-like permease family protein [Flavobacteriales bacterium]
MRTILKIAWRNIWRTPMRSLIVIGSIVMGIWAGIFVVAFSYGLNKQRTESSIKNAISHIQIHHPEYQKEYDSKFYLKEPDQLNSVLESDKSIESYAFRTLLNGMVSSPIKSNGVRIIGVNKNQEKELTTIYSGLVKGTYFESKRRNPILIGEALAEKLKVKLQSKVVLTFQDTENTIISGAFRVCGIYKTQYSKYDQGTVFIENKDLHRLLKSENFHQVALLCNSINQVDSTYNSLKTNLPEYEVKDWKSIAPELAYADKIMESWLFLIMIIIMLALIFGIINTMLMAVFERRKELGMLMAIGMNRSKIFLLILIETLFLSLIGAPTGLVLGALTIKITSETGINLAFISKGLENVGLGSVIYPQIESYFYLFITVMVFLFTLIAAIYPSRKALMLKPTEAIRTI